MNLELHKEIMHKVAMIFTEYELTIKDTMAILFDMLFVSYAHTDGSFDSLNDLIVSYLKNHKTAFENFQQQIVVQGNEKQS